MNIESLPNELLINFFKYLSTTHLLRAFHGLNAQFNSLLLDHFQIQGFDFQFISRLDFDTICRTYLPRIKSIKLLRFASVMTNELRD